MGSDGVDLSTYILQFGIRWRGTRIQEVDQSYLSWMVNAKAGPWEIAEAELERRGWHVPEVDLSGHAIDSASLRIRRQWHADRNQAEGLHSWLCRVVPEALEHGESPKPGVYIWKGVNFVIATSGRWPILKTVTPAKAKKEPDG